MIRRVSSRVALQRVLESRYLGGELNRPRIWKCVSRSVLSQREHCGLNEVEAHSGYVVESKITNLRTLLNMGHGGSESSHMPSHSDNSLKT